MVQRNLDLTHEVLRIMRPRASGGAVGAATGAALLPDGAGVGYDGGEEGEEEDVDDDVDPELLEALRQSEASYAAEQRRGGAPFSRASRPFFFIGCICTRGSPPTPLRANEPGPSHARAAPIHCFDSIPFLSFP